MCQDCYQDGEDRVDDRYRDDDDDWYGDDRDDYEEPDYGYHAELNAEYEHRERVHGGAFCGCRERLRDRITWRLTVWRRWLHAKLHPDRYDDQPPF